MKKGEYLIERFTQNDVEPRLWVVEGVNRGKALMRRVNPANLVSGEGTQRMDIAYAKRSMHKWEPDSELQDLARSFYQYRARIKNYVDALPREIDQE